MAGTASIAHPAFPQEEASPQRKIDKRPSANSEVTEVASAGGHEGDEGCGKSEGDEDCEQVQNFRKELLKLDKTDMSC